MTQRTHKQVHFAGQRRSLRRWLASLPPSKKLELVMFTGMGLMAFVLIGMLVA